jgi:hypothetical protein
MLTKRVASRMLLASAILFGLVFIVSAVILFNTYGCVGDNSCSTEKLKFMAQIAEINRYLVYASIIGASVAVLIYFKADK